MAFNVNEPRDDHGKWTSGGFSTKNVAQKVSKATQTHNKPMTDAESIAKTGRDLAWHRANNVQRLIHEFGLTYNEANNPDTVKAYAKRLAKPRPPMPDPRYRY